MKASELFDLSHLSVSYSGYYAELNDKTGDVEVYSSKRVKNLKDDPLYKMTRGIDYKLNGRQVYYSDLLYALSKSAMWQNYIKSRNETKESKDFDSASYFVVATIVNGSPRFSSTPFKHFTEKCARDEVERLINEGICEKVAYFKMMGVAEKQSTIWK